MASLETAKISNPKRTQAASTGRAALYPYYAGFSQHFAIELLDSCNLSEDAVVLDPWNGSGTTTASAAALARKGLGVDINPVMVLVARARLLNRRECASLIPIAKHLIDFDKQTSESYPADPLGLWLTKRAIDSVRTIEFRLQKLLLDCADRVDFKSFSDPFSDLTAFYYVALFRAIRRMLASLASTNPTWMKSPSAENSKIAFTCKEFKVEFLDQVVRMSQSLLDDSSEKDGKSQITVGTSEQLDIPSASVDFVLSSPPYCTRIDYAVATRPELALLGFDNGEEFSKLRGQTIGTTSITLSTAEISPEWGPTCGRFLNQMKCHASKASSTYYLKNHCQYFASLSRSISEIHRVLKPGASCALVVQDSHYKDLHNDLPQIVSEIADCHGLTTSRREDFVATRNFARLNPQVRSYRSKPTAVESVVCFNKT